MTAKLFSLNGPIQQARDGVVLKQHLLITVVVLIQGSHLGDSP